MMKNKFITILLLSVALLLGACGGGDDNPGVTPSSLAGTWYGAIKDPASKLFTLQIVIDNTGTITSIIQGGIVQGSTSTGPVVKEEGNNIFSFTLTDGTEGGFIVDGGGTHAGFVNEDFNFGVLQKGASSTPSYQNSDLVGSWNGYSVELTASFDIDQTYNSNVTVNNEGKFTGSNSLGDAFNGSFNSVESLGRWTGGWFADDSSDSGLVVTMMSVDKAFVASYACSYSGSFPTGCSFSAWNK